MLKKLVLQLMFMLALGVFAGSLCLFGSLSVSAQPAGPGGMPGINGERWPARLDELMTSLKLSSQQATSTQNILDSERQSMRALDESIRPQRDAIRQATRKKLAATLTPEQLARYDEWREANRPPHPQDEPAGNRPAPKQNTRPQ